MLQSFVHHPGRGFIIKAFLLAAFLSLPVTSAFVAAPPEPNPARECDCHNLEDLQLELRNAITLQQRFRGKIADLEKMSAESAAMEYARFAETAGRGLPQVGKGEPAAIDYTSRGDTISPDDQGHVKGERLCERSTNAELELNKFDQQAACAGIAAAVRAHEDYHKAECTRLSYASYRDKHAANRAREEVEAYGVQIAALRAEIARVLERSTVRIVMENNTRTQIPPNPLYTAINIDTHGEVQATRIQLAGDIIKIDGQGEQNTTPSVEGNCVFEGTIPIKLGTRGGLETDGLEAQIHYSVEGTMPGVGMKCTLPGQGSGSGMSMPMPMNSGSNVPPDIKLPLRDGVEVVTDMTNSQAAQIMSRGGARVSGVNKIRLVIECP
ncbi:MAG: hypothetical protein M3R69_19045 [Acidobacteriota bacterium]|nr:hypothetical protein [Acidobacteriota bacterium]